MIGLFSPYRVDNYGTKLQAYAVQNYINGYDTTEIISYIPSISEKIISKVWRIILYKYSDKKYKVDFRDIDKELIKQRKKAINGFNSRYRIRTVRGRRKLKLLAREYSAVVCGSDQIWNPLNIAKRTMMLEFVPDDIKKISFSPSFGIDYIPKIFAQMYKHRLSRFEYLSVREKSGVSIVRNLGIEQVKHLVDPTILLPKDTWVRLSNTSKMKMDRPYIFCYFLGTLSLGRDVAKEIKTLTNIDIVNLPHFKTYVEYDDGLGDIDLYNVSPEDFLQLIREASYVITDSFHCMVFSIVFQKNFIAINRHEETEGANTNSRIDSLLETFCLTRRKIKTVSDCKIMLSESIDYRETIKVLEEKKKEAKAFFDKAFA